VFKKVSKNTLFLPTFDKKLQFSADFCSFCMHFFHLFFKTCVFDANSRGGFSEGGMIDVYVPQASFFQAQASFF
jgi:hypothetical protein